ncbi:MAG: Nif3-like dinuclear metal center hexameric protein [Erysipelotrichaceae bacterium]|nr:Nif3-like dinuclear metal center hexameric protein [Erysipelotrichaceae bacterium]
MKISEVISKMKAYHKGEYNGIKIDDTTSRDQVLYGNPDKECTGIVTTCWATVDVICQAHKLGYNFIICHEALFWNHGDKTDWLINQNNITFAKKKKLLDETGIVVWRDHDYIHSGIPMGDSYVDGIFYGVAKKLGWEDYMMDGNSLNMIFHIPATTARQVGQLMVEKYNLNGIKMMGDIDAKVKKVWMAAHVFGVAEDNNFITTADSEKIDLIIPLECVDFTFSEYVRDSGMLGISKAMVMPGHFNGEEPGMEYMLTYLNDALKEEIPSVFIQSGDMYHFYCR